MGASQSSSATNQNTPAPYHGTGASHVSSSNDTCNIEIDCDKVKLKFFHDYYLGELVTKISGYGTLSKIEASCGKIYVEVNKVRHASSLSCSVLTVFIP